MQTVPTSYPACASHPTLGEEGIAGELRIQARWLEFHSESVQLSWNLDCLTLQKADERIILKGPPSDDWTIDTYSVAVLDNPFLRQRTHTREQLRALDRSQPEAVRHARLVFATLAGLVALILLLSIGSGPMIRVLARRAPMSWEAQIGRELLSEIGKEYEFTTEPAITNQLEPVLRRLLPVLPPSSASVRIQVIDSPERNAFAIPGGTVLVLRGLIERAGSPEELAGVLAHEFAHVAHRHVIRQMAESAGPAFIAERFFGRSSQLLAEVTAASAIVGDLTFSRRYEREADDLAWQLLLKAKIDPRGLIQFFLRNRDFDLAAGPAFLSTHPPTRERIRTWQRRWAELPIKSGFVPIAPSPTN